MFKNLSTSAKLFILCTVFLISIGVPVYALVQEKRIAIEFARQELIGSRYLVAVREVYAAILSPRSRGEHVDVPRTPTGDAVLKALAEAEAHAGAGLQTAEAARALADALGEYWAGQAEGGGTDALLGKALAEARALTARIGDDSNLALDPDLDSYYVQNLIVRLMPTFLGRLSRLQQSFEASIEAESASTRREVPVLASLVRSTAGEIESDIEAAYRGNPDGSLKAAVAGGLAALISSIESYLGVLGASVAGIDARNSPAYDRYHAGTVDHAIRTWAIAQSELDRLLQRRIDGLLARMQADLALICAFAALSIFLAVLTHRHIVRPLRRLEVVASAVRETRDYSLRVEHPSRDEIGRVAAAFDDMLSDLAAARERETAERAEFARVSRLTAMGEMAASIAHEVNQPLAAIVASGNAGLRWLANDAADLGKVRTVLQRVVRDGMRASEVVGSVRSMFRKEGQARASIDVNDLLTEVLLGLHGELQSEQIAVQMELGEGLPAVSADRVQLQQVFVNLITNGIDAMRSVRDPPRQLRLGAKVVEADAVLITVGDTGPGVDANVRDRVFDPFFTTKSGGMGLGLSICRSIIEAHGGRVWVSPGNPRGTDFHFILPISGA